MAKPWATFGVDLHLEPAGPGLRRGLTDALREAVRGGRLAPGTRLPSSRSLAADLGIARNTVAEAYAELVAEGWLTARQGSGTRVAERPVLSRPPDRPARQRRTPGRLPYSLVPGSPDVSTFPRAAWLKAARRALTAAPNDALDYGDPRGRVELRTALADYLSRARGVRADPEHIVICSGFAHGLRILAEALHTGGTRTLAVESYGLDVHWNLLERAGLRTTPLPFDALGTRTEELMDVGAEDVRGHGWTSHEGIVERAADSGTAGEPWAAGPGRAGADRAAGARGGDPTGGRGPGDTAHQAGGRTSGAPLADPAGLRAERPRVALLTPAHQFPMGVALRPERRAAVVEWARRNGGLVLEDDYDGEFRYDRQPVGALQDLDPDHVVYLGTASKSLAPGLRLGWLVLPPSLTPEVTRLGGAWSTGVLEQLTLAEFLTSGAYDRHVRAARQRYRARRDALVEALADRAPKVRATGIAAGLHAVLRLPPGTEESVVRAAAAWQGLALHGLSRYRHPAAEAQPMDALVVGYGTPPDHAWAGTLEALCRALP